MFDEWRKRSILQREINALEKDKSKLDEIVNKEEVSKLNTKMSSLLQKLDIIATDRLLEKANQLGLEIPLEGVRNFV
jgi:predicted nuclease with TOPRIM domain